MSDVHNAAEAILTVNNIEVVYDHVILVLKGVSLSVPRAAIVALLGYWTDRVVRYLSENTFRRYTAYLSEL